MTKPKHPPHWLGFRDGLDDPELEPYRRTAEDVVEDAQWLFLLHVARDMPDVLISLHSTVHADANGEIDERSLTEWAERWHLTAEWCLAYARATWQAWQQTPSMSRNYWCPRRDGVGALVDDNPEESAARRLKDPAHFTWLVRYQCGRESFRKIAGSPDDDGPRGTVRDAVRRLAEFLHLTLRPPS